MTEEDLETVLQWRNSAQVRQVMYTSHEISLDEHRAWFARKQADPSWHLLIFEDQSQPSGYVSLYETTPGKVAEWGFYVAPGMQKGTGTRLGLAALDYAFFDLKLETVRGEALAFNEASIRFHEKMGFRREDELKERQVDNWTHREIVCFSISAAEWRDARKRV